ncbi:hypothetical protein E3E22_10590 [Thermococcus sp. MV5]|uniref:hypothetical protein n=1 Tax=Thermococcus sp. MV5 TaxID=1638272 RepID=UPI001439D829|nr:hypothetical protein [Thermococcus sp. MV5]NJE27048.1 hypothetical protein [Thermococcus sp. MV5]
MVTETIISIGATAVITALLTAYSTAKANEKVLGSIVNRLDDLEEKLFNHEKRISHLEGKVSYDVVKVVKHG